MTDRQEDTALTKAGRWAERIAVLTFWTDCFVWVGIVEGLGVMLPTLQTQFETKTWIIGWMIAMVMGMSGFTGWFCLHVQVALRVGRRY